MSNIHDDEQKGGDPNPHPKKQKEEEISTPKKLNNLADAVFGSDKIRDNFNQLIPKHGFYIDVEFTIKKRFNRQWDDQPLGWRGTSGLKLQMKATPISLYKKHEGSEWDNNYKVIKSKLVKGDLDNEIRMWAEQLREENTILHKEELLIGHRYMLEHVGCYFVDWGTDWQNERTREVNLAKVYNNQGYYPIIHYIPATIYPIIDGHSNENLQTFEQGQWYYNTITPQPYEKSQEANTPYLIENRRVRARYRYTFNEEKFKEKVKKDWNKEIGDRLEDIKIKDGDLKQYWKNSSRHFIKDDYGSFVNVTIDIDVSLKNGGVLFVGNICPPEVRMENYINLLQQKRQAEISNVMELRQRGLRLLPLPEEVPAITEFNVDAPYLMGGAMNNCYLTKEFEKRFGCIVDPKDRTTVIGMQEKPDYNSFHWKMLNTDDVRTLRGPNDNASRYLVTFKEFKFEKKKEENSQYSFPTMKIRYFIQPRTSDDKPYSTPFMKMLGDLKKPPVGFVKNKINLKF